MVAEAVTLSDMYFPPCDSRLATRLLMCELHLSRCRAAFTQLALFEKKGYCTTFDLAVNGFKLPRAL